MQNCLDTDREALALLEKKINALLPPQYVGCFEDVPPSSMGSAALKYDKEGKVAWGAIWTTFCHLALAGGPPHRGTFLGPVPAEEVEAHPNEHAAVVQEIKRAIRLSSELKPRDDETPGWVAIQCHDEDMARWLVRAIVAENVIARNRGDVLEVPAGPFFRIEKEIKNVVVCVAKCCHYLLDHVPPAQRPRGLKSDLIQPLSPEEIACDPAVSAANALQLAREIQMATGLATTPTADSSWIENHCPNEAMAVWMMRALIAENVLARREDDRLFVPFCDKRDAEQLLSIIRQTAHCWSIHMAHG